MSTHSKTNKPFVLIYDKREKEYQVLEARGYQKEGLDTFISLGRDSYYYSRNGYKFTIRKYDSVTEGLKGDYSDCYEIVREDQSTFLISYNSEKMRGLCGFINRVAGGS